MNPRIIRKFKTGIEIELVDYYQSYQGWYESSETETQDWIVDYVEKDWVCFEVGAHLGYYAMVMSLLAYNGQIVAFEASDQTCTMMKNNIEYNKPRLRTDFKNLTIVNTAVGHFDAKNTWEKLWITGRPGIGETLGSFDFITIDTYIRNNNHERLDLLMVDADGWDYDVLRGARYAMTDLRPYVIMEANYALGWRNHTFEEVQEYLGETGYYWKWLDQQCPGNLLAIPKEKL